MKVVHSWLKDYLGNALPTPERVEELLTFHSFEIDGLETVEGETVIDVDEKKVRALLAQEKETVAGEIIAQLIIERQEQKIKSKEQFISCKSNICQ